MSLWRQLKNLLVKTDANAEEIRRQAARLDAMEQDLRALRALQAEAELAGMGED